MNEQNGRSAVLGLQHLLAMYAGAVAVPLLIGTGLGFNEAQMTYLISIDIFYVRGSNIAAIDRHPFLRDRIAGCLGLCHPSCFTIDFDRN